MSKFVHRVRKGGSCFYDFWSLRSTSRRWDVPEFRYRDSGFRLVIRKNHEQG